MRIGQVAASTGVSVQAVRLYERRGLLKPARRLQSGYRDYSADAITFIRFIKQAQAQGFTLDEIKALIQLRAESPTGVERMRQLAKAKLDAIDKKIHRLQAQRDAIEHGLNNCRCSEKFPLCIFTRLINQSESA